MKNISYTNPLDSIWRPIVDVVEDVPLALCDARTTTPEDMVETDHVRKHYLGAALYLMAREKYRWYYLHRQRKDEVTLLKMFDSDPDVEAKCEYFALLWIKSWTLIPIQTVHMHRSSIPLCRRGRLLGKVLK